MGILSLEPGTSGHPKAEKGCLLDPKLEKDAHWTLQTVDPLPALQERQMLQTKALEMLQGILRQWKCSRTRKNCNLQRWKRSPTSKCCIGSDP